MKVLKFGGTSVGSIDAIRAVGRIVADFVSRGEEVIVVSSAFSGVTNELIAVATAARDGDEYEMHSIRHQILERHLHAAKELVQGKSRPVEVSDLLEVLAKYLLGICHLRELSPRTLDLVMSFGERLSCTILARMLRDSLPGTSVEFCDARKLIRTDDSFGCAVVNFEVTNAAIRAHFAGATKGKVHVVTGFIGSTCDPPGARDAGADPDQIGETVTLGRGGGDYTASIIGGALEAEEVQIWTDVDGVMTAHPGIVGADKVQVIETLSYEEAMEMSYFGAKVIYSPTMGPAMRANVPIVIKNTFNPSAPGTRIHSKAAEDRYKIRGITGIDHIALLVLEGNGMVGVAGIAGRLFTAIARKKVNVVMISQASSEHSICLAIAPEAAQTAKSCVDEEFDREIERGLVEPAQVCTDLSVVAIVGDQMKHTAGIASVITGELGEEGINIVAIAQGSSERNISIVVARAHASRAVEVLHAAFFCKRICSQAWLRPRPGGMPTKIPIPPTAVYCYVAGTGAVGTALLSRFKEQRDSLLRDRNVRLRVAGVMSDTKMLLFDKGAGRRPSHNGSPPDSRDGSNSDLYTLARVPSTASLDDTLDSDDWVSALQELGCASDVRTFCDSPRAEMAESVGVTCVFIDCTNTPALPAQYASLHAARVHVISANPHLGALPHAAFHEVSAASLRSGAPRLLFAGALGADPAAAALLRMSRTAPDTVCRVTFCRPQPTGPAPSAEQCQAEAVTLARLVGLSLEAEAVDATAAGAPAESGSELEISITAPESRRAGPVGERQKAAAVVGWRRPQQEVAGGGDSAAVAQEACLAVYPAQRGAGPLTLRFPAPSPAAAANAAFADLVSCVK